jgi:hypothetical protein
VYLSNRTITKSTRSSSSSSSTQVPPQPSIAERTLAERASARTRKRIPTNMLGGELPCSGATTGELGPGKNSDRTLLNGCRGVDTSSGAGVVQGANDFDLVNVASTLRPLLEVCGFEMSKGRAFPFPLSIFGRDSGGSGTESEASAGTVLINSDPTLAYPRGARRLSHTRSVAAGTRRATAISSSGTSGSCSTCPWEGSDTSTFGGHEGGGSRLRSGRGCVTR